jgi:putative oligomerization/nucleic acid binding protein
MFRRRRPLLRAAAVGGTAYYAGKKVAENQADQQAYEAEAAAAAEPTGVTDDAIHQLKELAALKEQGILTDAEFEEQKRKILNS